MCAQQRRTLLRADALSWQTATTAFGVETNGKQTNRPKRKTLPAQTFGICRARTCRARSQPWSEGGPSRQGKAIRAVQHGREVAPRPTPTIKASGQRGIRSNGHRRSPACPSELSQELRPERFGFRRSDIEAKHLAAAVAVDTNRDDHRDRQPFLLRGASASSACAHNVRPRRVPADKTRKG